MPVFGAGASEPSDRSRSSRGGPSTTHRLRRSLGSQTGGPGDQPARRGDIPPASDRPVKQAHMPLNRE
eukprot:13927506-Alexandrium_andersonii.AAC.1